MIGHDEINFSHNLLLNDIQVPSFCKAFANKSSANMKFKKNTTMQNNTVSWILWWTSLVINENWFAI